MMTVEYKEYRRRSGMAKFERLCRLTSERGRMKKAYKVPGTREHGKWCNYSRHFKGQKYIY